MQMRGAAAPVATDEDGRSMDRGSFYGPPVPQGLVDAEWARGECGERYHERTRHEEGTSCRHAGSRSSRPSQTRNEPNASGCSKIRGIAVASYVSRSMRTFTGRRVRASGAGSIPALHGSTPPGRLSKPLRAVGAACWTSPRVR